MLLPDGTEIPGTGHPVRWTGCGLMRTEPGSPAAPVHVSASDSETGPVPAAAESRAGAIRRLLRRLAGL